MNCPGCNSENARRSMRRGLYESLVLRLMVYAPFRCQECGLRFVAHAGGGDAGTVSVRRSIVAERRRLLYRLTGGVLVLVLLGLATVLVYEDWDRDPLTTAPTLAIAASAPAEVAAPAQVTAPAPVAAPVQIAASAQVAAPVQVTAPVQIAISSQASALPEVAAPAPLRPVALGLPAASFDQAAARSDIERVVSAWARAWAGRRIDEYLDHYSARFVPEKRTGRAEWERQRRERIGAARDISIGLDQLEFGRLESGTAEVSFRQRYSAKGLADVSRKTLTLEFADGRWLILGERSVAVAGR